VATAIGNPALSMAVVFALLRSGFSAAPANRGLIKHLQPNGIRNLIYDVEVLLRAAAAISASDNSWLPAASVPLPAPAHIGGAPLATSASSSSPQARLFCRRNSSRARRSLDAHVAMRFHS
jgi:hypothetical protein